MAQKIRMKKREHWTPLGIFGLLCTILVTVIAVFPFIYMFLMSFTESRTLKLHLADVDFTNMENFIYIFQNSGFFAGVFQQCRGSRCILRFECGSIMYGSIRI